jgi:hypothetical protein
VTEWTYVRGGLIAVGLITVAALAGWGVQTAVYEDPAFEKTQRCLVNEKGATVTTPRDPVAASAELGALQTVVETNVVTVSVASSQASAERIAAAYRAVGGDLGERLEVRGRTVYLWERPPSPTQRQTVYDCAY